MGLISFLINFFKKCDCECKPIFEVPMCRTIYEAEDSEYSEDSEYANDSDYIKYSEADYNIYINRLPDDF